MQKNNTSIAVVGGIYREICMHPDWDEYYGSGGRALRVLQNFGVEPYLYTFFDKKGTIKMICQTSEYKVSSVSSANEEPIIFKYHHSLESPNISHFERTNELLKVQEEKVIQFGMLEGEAIVHADYVVYDPQNPKPKSFYANGSTTNHLALVLNECEAAQLAKQHTPKPYEAAAHLLKTEKVDVVIIKMGPKGLLVCDHEGTALLPPYQTKSVWKVGSGDTFVATFGYFWMAKNYNPIEAATLASKATAFFVTNQYHIDEEGLKNLDYPAVSFSDRYLISEYKPKIYLAGPFFNLSQLWIVDEVRKAFGEMGMDVFSPLHRVGRGNAEQVVEPDLKGIDDCDVVYAVADNLDSGTIFEVGYAISKNKPVVVYAENETEESLKMMVGTGCFICTDFATSIYRTVWIAVGT